MARDIRSWLARRIKTLRKERGWAQEDLAAHAEVSRTSISAIETARSEPGLETILAVAHSFDMTMPELFDGFERPRSGPGNKAA